jgi:cyclophilin family peptidyl-prolyl cis-trans isomerase
MIFHKLNYILNKKVNTFLICLFCIAFTINAQQKIRMETSMGDIVFILYDETPKHKSNFMRLVSEGYYNGLLFHRVIPKFMIQGGDPESKNATGTKRLGNGGPGYTISAEINPKFIHKKGALCAARLGDQENPQKKSSGSQFYFVQGSVYPKKYLPRFEEKSGIKYTEEQIIAYETLGGTPHLDGGYTVFGEIIRGLDVLEKISATKTGRGDRPIEDVKIISVKLIK